MRYDPYAHAEGLGVTVVWGDPGPGLVGLYDHGHRRIVLRDGLTRRVERCVLAHEILHHEHGDELTRDPMWAARREERCDRVAASRLIRWEDYLAAAVATDDPGALCLELDVTAWILSAYHRALTPGQVAELGCRRADAAA